MIIGVPEDPTPWVNHSSEKQGSMDLRVGNFLSPLSINLSYKRNR